jgi:hypothetical protein
MTGFLPIKSEKFAITVPPAYYLLLFLPVPIDTHFGTEFA